MGRWGIFTPSPYPPISLSSSCLRVFVAKFQLMNSLLKIVAGMVIVGGLAASGYAEIVDRIVAVVNRKVITLYQLQQAEKELSQEQNAPQEAPPAMRAKVLDILIEKELIRQRAEAEGIVATEEEVQAALADIRQRNKMVSDEQIKQALGQEGKSWQEFLEDVRTQIKMAKLSSREIRAKVEITEEEVKAYYQAHPELFEPAPASVHVRQILLKVKEGADDAEIQSIKAKAVELVQKLRAGADFAAFAKEFSEHASAQTGGELGTFKQGELAAPFDSAFNMQAGEISEPVRSAQGFHIIYVQEKLSGDQAAYENAVSQIRNKLGEAKSTELYQKWIAELKAKAYLEMK